MENADHQVLSQLTQWLADGQSCWLCTVVETWGSSPRPVGSMLSCNSQGHIAGSLSGGCVEEDLLEKLHNGELAQTTPELLIYGKDQEESDRFGLPCGGQLHIVIEPLSGISQLDALKTIVQHLEQRQCIERQLDIRSGQFKITAKDRFKHLQFKPQINADSNDSIQPINNQQHNQQNNQQNNKLKDKSADNQPTMVHTYGPRYQLFLIGAGQVSIYLAQIARTLDYQVLVCDPRPEMIEQWPITGVQLVNSMPDDAIIKYADDRFSAIIALTHDPRIDDMGLMEALKTDAFFIGAMGSSRTSAKRKERLLQLDLSETEVNKLHAPVGLSIGSKTPAEIAIAILAQLTALRSEAAKKELANSTAGQVNQIA